MPLPAVRLLRIGVVARSVGLSVDSLRHYERLGLLEPAARTEGGFRRYPEPTLHRVKVIQAALQTGFTLRELAAIFAERRDGRAPCRRVRALAAEKLAAVEAELRQLSGIRKALRNTLGEWDARLRTAAPGETVGLLESLAAAMAASQWPVPRVATKRKLRSRLTSHIKTGK